MDMESVIIHTACLEHFHLGDECPGSVSDKTRKTRRYSETRHRRPCRFTHEPEHIALVFRYRVCFPTEVIP